MTRILPRKTAIVSYLQPYACRFSWFMPVWEWQGQGAASWLWALSLSCSHLRGCKAAVADHPMHQMYSHGHVADELQMLHTNAETHKIRPCTRILSFVHAAKVLDRWPYLYVCIYQPHACYVCVWTVIESGCMSKAGRLQKLYRSKRQRKVTPCGVATRKVCG